MPIRAILFDMIGTTVLEKDPTVISACFENAFLHHGVSVDIERIRNVRGMDKKEAIDVILKLTGSSPNLKLPIVETFRANVLKQRSNFEEHPELKDVVSELRTQKVKIGIASGLSHEIFQMLFEKFGWQKYSFDYRNVYENFSKGRPDPAMIFDMCEKLKVDRTDLLKVGDTVADIDEGKNAGTVTAVVLAGTQSAIALRNANPDHVLNSLIEVLDILN